MQAVLSLFLPFQAVGLSHLQMLESRWVHEQGSESSRGRQAYYRTVYTSRGRAEAKARAICIALVHHRVAIRETRVCENELMILIYAMQDAWFGWRYNAEH